MTWRDSSGHMKSRLGLTVNPSNLEQPIAILIRTIIVRLNQDSSLSVIRGILLTAHRSHRITGNHRRSTLIVEDAKPSDESQIPALDVKIKTRKNIFANKSSLSSCRQ